MLSTAPADTIILLIMYRAFDAYICPADRRATVNTVLFHQVVINANVTMHCKYKRKSEDFHKFTDEEDVTYGFGFYKQKESTYADSEKFMEIVTQVIESSKVSATSVSPTCNSTDAQNTGSLAVPAADNNAGDVRRSSIPRNLKVDLGTSPAVEEDLAKHSYLALGALKIQPPSKNISHARAFTTFTFLIVNGCRARIRMCKFRRPDM